MYQQGYMKNLFQAIFLAVTLHFHHLFFKRKAYKKHNFFFMILPNQVR